MSDLKMLFQMVAGLRHSIAFTSGCRECAVRKKGEKKKKKKNALCGTEMYTRPLVKSRASPSCLYGDVDCTQ